MFRNGLEVDRSVEHELVPFVRIFPEMGNRGVTLQQPFFLNLIELLLQFITYGFGRSFQPGGAREN